MYILIVEDDHRQSDWIRKSLDKRFPRAEIQLIHTEFQFRSGLDSLVETPPDVVVMDVMLRWADPSPDIPEPSEDVRKAGFYRAGIRCAKLLAENEKTKNIPVILYTVLERTDLELDIRSLPLNIIHLRKESDPEPLARLIRSASQGINPIRESPREDFDVALSFAGEDRAFVEIVARHLKESEFRVFYDRDEEIYLWGKDIGDAFDEVYRLRSKFVIIFISKSYAEKMWTNHERKSAFARAIEEKREYVLPARFDDTELTGLRPTMGYIDLRRETPETFASKIVRKLTQF